jgi:hypothetical protein
MEIHCLLAKLLKISLKLRLKTYKLDEPHFNKNALYQKHNLIRRKATPVWDGRTFVPKKQQRPYLAAAFSKRGPRHPHFLQTLHLALPLVQRTDKRHEVGQKAERRDEEHRDQLLHEPDCGNGFWQLPARLDNCFHHHPNRRYSRRPVRVYQQVQEGNRKSAGHQKPAN